MASNSRKPQKIVFSMTNHKRKRSLREVISGMKRWQILSKFLSPSRERELSDSLLAPLS